MDSALHPFWTPAQMATTTGRNRKMNVVNPGLSQHAIHADRMNSAASGRDDVDPAQERMLTADKDQISLLLIDVDTKLGKMMRQYLNSDSLLPLHQ